MAGIDKLKGMAACSDRTVWVSKLGMANPVDGYKVFSPVDVFHKSSKLNVGASQSRSVGSKMSTELSKVCGSTPPKTSTV